MRTARGVITDRSTGQPIYLANVYVANENGTQKDMRGTTTNFNGEWEIQGVDTSEKIGISHQSYGRMVTSASGLVNGESLISLEPATVQLNEFEFKPKNGLLTFVSLVAASTVVVYLGELIESNNNFKIKTA